MGKERDHMMTFRNTDGILGASSIDFTEPARIFRISNVRANANFVGPSMIQPG
jgi:hypothetical protein